MQEWFYSLALALACGRRGEVFRQLCARFGAAKGALAADAQDLAQVAGPQIAARMKDPALLAEAGEEAEALARLGASVLPLGEPGYPSALAAIVDPPPVLFVRGTLPPARRPVVGIVGARRADEYGTRVSAQLARDLARRGAVVVSGGALGIDAAAHRAALAEHGPTVAVLGCGLGETYPKEHASLFDEIAASGGALLSELPVRAPARPENFPRRNRIISGLSEAVIVVRGEHKSGALYTARAARDQGRRLYAVPGPVGDALSHLPHKLLREGASLCEGADDVLFAEPSPQLSLFDAPGPRLSGDAKRLYDALAAESEPLDMLAARAGLSAPRAGAALLELELAGLCAARPGGRYSRRDAR